MNKSKSTKPQSTESQPKPLLVFDGECGFCRRLASKWHEKTGEQIDFTPANEITDNFRHTSLEGIENEIKLIYPEGRVYSGAAAAFKVIEQSQSPLRMLSWIYNHTHAFDPIWEWIYKIVSRNRHWIMFAK